MKLFDLKYIKNEITYLAGTDEAGRGPLAGPVVAAAVIFENDTVIDKINDSKKISENKRNILFDLINESALTVGIGIVDQDKIDEINILNASLLAMKIAVQKLTPQPDIILIDGNKKFMTNILAETIIKGDSKSFSIAAASIIAKVTRDRLMIKYSEDYPQYNWTKNKGYPTKEHRELILKYGVSPIHRKTFLRKLQEANNELKLI